MISLRLLALVAASLLPLSVKAAEIPREGTDSFTNIWVSTSTNNIQQGTQSFVTYEIEGVARNDAGGSMFDLFGQRCIGMSNGVAGDIRDQGTCTYTDRDGDNIFMPYSARNGRGTYQLAGGTGKFTGITGSGEYVINNSGQIKSDDKNRRGFVSNKVTWKLP